MNDGKTRGRAGENGVQQGMKRDWVDENEMRRISGMKKKPPRRTREQCCKQSGEMLAYGLVRGRGTRGLPSQVDGKSEELSKGAHDGASVQSALSK